MFVLAYLLIGFVVANVTLAFDEDRFTITTKDYLIGVSLFLFLWPAAVLYVLILWFGERPRW